MSLTSSPCVSKPGSEPRYAVPGYAPPTSGSALPASDSVPTSDLTPGSRPLPTATTSVAFTGAAATPASSTAPHGKPQGTLLSEEPQVITFGCRLNAYESEVMRDHARTQGLHHTVIVNTCAVTKEAERQGRQAIRRLKRLNPQARIIVTGCSAQINPQTYAQMPEVYRVLGNKEKMQPASFQQQDIPRVHVTDIMEVQETAYHLISGFENRARAFIQIQNGCNHRCTFCRIPYGRGPNRSVPLGVITEQMKKLVQEGCQEIVFTGVDITDYGQDLPGQPTLTQMIRRVLQQVSALPRLRLSSIDPAELGDEFFDFIATEPRLMPHYHLSLQSGDDMILKRMKRRHRRDHLITFCQRVRAINPKAVFGADIIAGFPTETPEMFLNTLNIIEECGLTYLHIFPYSAVDGTPAARMPQLPPPTIKERAVRLRQAGAMALEKFFKTLVGSTQQVLIETQAQGYTETYAPVQIQNTPALQPGSIVTVKITGYTASFLHGIREEDTHDILVPTA